MQRKCEMALDDSEVHSSMLAELQAKYTDLAQTCSIEYETAQETERHLKQKCEEAKKLGDEKYAQCLEQCDQLKEQIKELERARDSLMNTSSKSVRVQSAG
ncbi:hypothetical protein OBBRIDRAFT_396377 [Obba rivulosa]|uniref:Uncharacterized protein n=1 Tax=Obba rivulosa TaxID=1052685 RepID=A0A8E2DF41_9APHY|nr:hypothetical protein OBBRIDRAFT_396377 [Obba rivulosa]